ncbi:MAG: putative lipopolysaccharide heptosyltransferase III [Nitrospiraceae bacterium]|nr:putative lipopolysaccharide heptosyltransferase III [Nitrospiraceae bacterium]
MSFQNILVIKLRHIGDVLLSTPVLHEIRQAYPSARLTILLNRGTEAVLANNPDLDHVLFVQKGPLAAQIEFLRQLRARQFDCVIDLTDGDRSAMLSLVTGAPVRVGFNGEHRWRGLLYSSVAKPRPADSHRVEYDLCSLREIGLDPKPGQPRVYPSSSDEAVVEEWLRTSEAVRDRAVPMVLLQPGARYSLKVWPQERYAQVADHLAERYGFRVLLGGDDRERPVAEAVAREARSASVVVAGRFTLLQFAALLKRCVLFVGNDGGAMHIAAAVGTPVVALFGPTYPQRWGPRGGATEILYKGLDCRACFHPTCLRGDDSCLRQIGVGEVCAAADRLLGRRPGRLGPAEGGSENNAAPSQGVSNSSDPSIG